ncbi:MAG: DUF1517 domain-containing protein [Deltaproteobacteria bacterium]|nr:DUF1517 domain-containing protein [Deltaproteobacteria bacterium]
MTVRSEVTRVFGVVATMALVLLIAAPSVAQRRGGRISGGSFSRSSGSGSSSFGSSSRSRSRSSSSSFGSRSRSRSSSSSRGSSGSSSYGSSSGSSSSYVPPPVPMTEATANGLVPRRSGRPPFPRRISHESSPEVRVPGGVMRGGAAPEPRRGGWLAGVAGAGAAFLPLAGIALFLTRRRKSYRKKAKKAPWEIRRISLAFDWTVRAELQAELERIASEGGTSSATGLARVGKQVAKLLRERIGAARYGLAMREPIHEKEAEKRFVERANELRSRFREEIVNGTRRIEGLPPSVPRPEEGEGLVVVTIIAGVFDRDRRDIDPGRLGMAVQLDRIIPRANDLGPLEIIWSPADGGDRMSSLELEALYPELLPLDEGTPLGRKDCGFCGAPYAKELGVCPACGAPEELT